MMGSAAPLVQPDDPGHTVPGAAPSAKVTEATDPPPPDRGACTPSRAGESGRPESQDANSTMHPRAIKLFMAASVCGGRVVRVQRNFRTLMLHPGPTDGSRCSSITFVA